MFNNFVAGLMEKIFHFLVKHPDLFKSEGKKRIELLENLQLAQTFKDYLAEISEKHFMDDMKQALDYSQKAKELSLQGNKFFAHIVEFLTHEIALKIDLMPDDFSLLKTPERIEISEKLISGASTAAQSLREILVNFSYQQIANEIHQLANAVKKTPYILVQTPRSLDEKFKEKSANNFWQNTHQASRFFKSTAN